MLNNLVYVAVFVSDQEKALDFYTNVLGFEKRIDVPSVGGSRFLTVGIEGQDLSLVLWPGTPGRGTLVQGMPPAQYTIETSDCHAAFETLSARGVKFEPSAVLEQPWGLIARFEDLDGNQLQVRQLRP
jgi:catechol 2,3-dioxygenase-like lactoylglutathione lyase family enzyme